MEINLVRPLPRKTRSPTLRRVIDVVPVVVVVGVVVVVVVFIGIVVVSLSYL